MTIWEILDSGFDGTIGACRYQTQHPSNTRTIKMTLCPVAIVAGCKKCPVFSICPLKSVIGDYIKETEQPKQSPEKPAK